MTNNYLIAIAAALEAGKEILKVYNSDDFQVELKGDNSPLTQADKNAHLKITAYLKNTNIPVLSEEGKEILFEQRKSWNQLWIVDPLDGTKEFIKRNGEFTVNIALVENNIPIFGVIYVPVTKELFIGIQEKGSFKLTEIQTLDKTVSSIDDLLRQGFRLPFEIEKKFTVVASRSHLNDDTQEFIGKLKEQHPDLDFISKGSSLKLCAVAEGVANVYPRYAPTMEWDTAAGDAIVRAMGGSVLQINGKPLMYNKENLLNPYFIVKEK